MFLVLFKARDLKTSRSSDHLIGSLIKTGKNSTIGLDFRADSNQSREKAADGLGADTVSNPNRKNVPVWINFPRKI